MKSKLKRPNKPGRIYKFINSFQRKAFSNTLTYLVEKLRKTSGDFFGQYQYEIHITKKGMCEKLRHTKCVCSKIKKIKVTIYRYLRKGLRIDGSSNFRSFYNQNTIIKVS